MWSLVLVRAVAAALCLQLPGAPDAFPSEPHADAALDAVRAATFVDRFCQAPLHGPSVAAFEAARPWLAESGSRPLILDSGCGTGRSTRALAAANPDAVVIGVDRSEARLSRSSDTMLPENALVIRAELGTFWRLLLREEDAAARVCHHSIYYPNPYPKPSQLRKRWHCHPALPLIMALRGSIEVRSNWRVYLDEFIASVEALAVEQPGVPEYVRKGAARRLPASLEAVHLENGRDAVTNFEEKYWARGDPLWRLLLPVPSATSGQAIRSASFDRKANS